MLAKVERLGGKPIMPETEIPSMRVKLAYFADPKGHIIGLSNGAAVGGRGDAGANPVLWFEVMSKDGKTLRNFYSDLFGWKISKASAFDYWMIEATSEGVAGGIGIGRSVPAYRPATLTAAADSPRSRSRLTILQPFWPKQTSLAARRLCRSRMSLAWA